MHLLSELLSPSTSGFIPRGQTYHWDRALMWLDASADLVIGSVYLLISLLLLWCYRRRPDFSRRWMFLPFAAFMVVCGFLQWFDVGTLWVPTYWAAGGVKAAAALVSLAAAVGLVGVTPWALSVRSTPLPQARTDERPRVEAHVQAVSQELEGPVREPNAELVAAALREAEERLRVLVEHAPEAMVVLDLELGRFSLVNENACRLFGLPRDELLQRGLIELSAPVQPDGRRAEESGREKIQAAARGETPVFEWMYRDGQARNVICETRLVRLPSSGAPLVRGSIIDISERKRVEDALRESEAKYLTVFRTCPGSLSISSLEDGRYRGVNDAYGRLFGYSRHGVIGRSAL